MSETIEAAAGEAATADVVAPATTQDAAPKFLEDQADATEGGKPEPDGEQPGAEGDAAPEPEVVEFQIGAEKIAIPKDAIPPDVLEKMEAVERSRQGDYTRKTQAVAEERRAVEAAQENLRQMMSMTAEVQRAVVAAEVFDTEAKAIRAQLPQLWNADPDNARRLSDEAARMEAAAAEQRQLVAGHQAKMAEQAQRAAAERHAKGVAEVRAAIKGFDENAERELIRYAVTQMGVSEADARAYGVTPKLAVAVWKAAQWDRLQANTKAATAAKPPAPPAGPVKAISGKNAPAAKNPDDMSEKEWLAWRNAQLAKRR